MQRPYPEDDAIRPAPDEASQPQREGDRGKVPDHVVGDHEVDRSGLPKRVWMREADADPFRRRARGGVVLAVDDVADPADGETERDSRSGRVGAEPDRHAAPDGRDVPAEDAANGRTPDGDSAGPDKKDLERVGEVVLPLIDDMNKPRADDPGHDAPRGDGPPVVLADLASEKTKGQPDSKEDSNRGEDSVPCERERTDMNIWIERDLNHGRKRHEAPDRKSVV